MIMIEKSQASKTLLTPIVNDINKWPYSQKQATDVRQGPFFAEAKEYSARYLA
jgi:hypothetical protein